MQRCRRVPPVLVLALTLAAMLSATSVAASGSLGHGRRAPVARSVPQITGMPIVGSVLRVSPGGWIRASRLAYRWNLCDAGGRRCTPISGSKRGRPSYTRTLVLSGRHVGHTIRVTVIASNAWGRRSAASRPTAVIRAQRLQVIAAPPSPAPTPTSPAPTPTLAPLPTWTPVLCPPPPPSTSDGLHVWCDEVLDASNNVVHFHGVNRAGTEYSCVHNLGIFEAPGVIVGDLGALTGSGFVV